MMNEYVFEGDVIIDGVRYKHDKMHTMANSVNQAKNNFVWKARIEYGLTRKLWVDVYLEGTLCTTKEYAEAIVRHAKLEFNKIYGEYKDLNVSKSAEQLEFPIDELIKKG